jgi:uncharacterized lipoprotein YmbA
MVCLLILASACGSSAPVRYYSLEALESRFGEDVAGSPGMGLGPLRMPDYLTRSRIVTRRDNSEVVVDDFNRWVEPVDEAVYRIIAANVDSLLEDVIVVAFPYNHFADLDYQVIGRVDRFDTDEHGRVVLVAQWSIMTPNSEFVVAPRRIRYETQASDVTDYGAVAAAMSEALAEFSRDIAREFRAVHVE